MGRPVSCQLCFREGINLLFQHKPHGPPFKTELVGTAEEGDVLGSIQLPPLSLCQPCAQRRFWV